MKSSQTPVFIFIAIFIVGVSASFMLGRASQTSENSKQDTVSSDVLFITSRDLAQEAENASTLPEIQIRASSRGTKYYFPWCSSTFNEENTVHFSSTSEAEAAGYALANNCIPKQN